MLGFYIIEYNLFSTKIVIKRHLKQHSLSLLSAKFSIKVTYFNFLLLPIHIYQIILHKRVSLQHSSCPIILNTYSGLIENVLVI